MKKMAKKNAVLQQRIKVSLDRISTTFHSPKKMFVSFNYSLLFITIFNVFFLVMLMMIFFLRIVIFCIMKSNLATNRIQTLITAMLQSDGKGNCLIRETEIDEVVSNVMDLAGRNSWKVKRDDIWEGFVKSVTKNNSATLIKTADNDSKFELRRRTEDEGEELRTKEVKEEKTPDSQKIQPITRLSDAQDTRKVASHTMQPNAPLFTKRNMTVTNNNNVHGIIAAPSNGTADSPIDIDSILFNDQSTADPIHSE